MRVHLDFETYSAVDLRERGVYVYASDPTTRILCLAYCIDDGAVITWSPDQGDWPRDLLDAAEKGATFHAWNAQFERLMCEHKTPLRILLRQWRCTQLAAASEGLPTSLEGCGKVFGFEKDMQGRRLMLKMCKPSSTEHTPGQLERLKAYCAQDVEVERGLHLRLKPLPDRLITLYEVDQVINDRGIAVDIDAVERLKDMCREQGAALDARMRELTDYAAVSCKAVAAIRDYLSALGVHIPDLSAATVQACLARKDLPEKAVAILEARRGAARSSVSKLDKMLAMASGPDNALRGMFKIHGAATGRWAGSGVQLQNLPRSALCEDAAEDALANEHESIESTTKLIRPCLIARPGRLLYTADYAAIEARVLAWVSGEEWRLREFRGEGHIYEQSGARMFNVPVSEVYANPELRSRAKVAELALGYGGATGALMRMGGTKLGLSIEDMKRIVYAWREANPAVVSFWDLLERAAIRAVSNPSEVTCVRSEHVAEAPCISFLLRDERLLMRLPSGRCVRYYKPRIDLTDRGGKQLTYIRAKGQNTIREHAWRGSLTENVCQAIAADVLASALIKLNADYGVVGHVHDEIICEVPALTVDELRDLSAEIDGAMISPGDWAKGLPLDVKGGFSRRYVKS